MAAVAAMAWVALPQRSDEIEAPAVQAAGFGPVPAAPVAVATGDAGRAAEEASVPAGYAGRRGIASYRDNDMSGAISAFEEAVAANPQDAESVNNLAQVLVREGRTPEALPLFDRAVALAPDKWAFRFNRARARGLMDDWQGAVEGYREADRVFPDDHITLFNLGLALQRTGRHAEAVTAFERVVEQEPDASLLLPLGQSYEALARSADAMRVYEQYLDLAPGGADAPAVRARLDRLGGAAPTAAATDAGGEASPAPGGN